MQISIIPRDFVYWNLAAESGVGDCMRRDLNAMTFKSADAVSICPLESNLLEFKGLVSERTLHF